MEGNVTNTSIVKNLLDAMRDINFNDLVNTFADMSAVKNPVKTDTEATKGLMAEVKAYLRQKKYKTLSHNNKSSSHLKHPPLYLMQ